jgi:hypothetical protein
MAASKAEVKYEQLLKISIGGRWLTVTKVSISGEAEEYKAKGIPLTSGPSGLGLPDELLDAAFVLGDFTDEKVEKALAANVNGEKLVLFGAGAEKKAGAELTEGEGKALKGYFCLIAAIGR